MPIGIDLGTKGGHVSEEPLEDVKDALACAPFWAMSSQHPARRDRCAVVIALIEVTLDYSGKKREAILDRL